MGKLSRYVLLHLGTHKAQDIYHNKLHRAQVTDQLLLPMKHLEIKPSASLSSLALHEDLLHLLPIGI